MAGTLPPLEAAVGARASEPLRRFLQAARGAGLRISAAEGIDAARAVDLVGYADRMLLKDTLGLVLAKTPDEKALYEETFELYFRRDEARPKPAPPASAAREASTSQGSAFDRSGDAGGGEPALSQLLENDDRAALASAMERAARAIGVENVRLLTQKNLYARRLVERMGLAEVEARLGALRESGSADDLERARSLEQRFERLRDAARDHVERALLLFARGETEQQRERMLKSARLGNIDPSQHERMKALVRRLARRIATRYALKRRRRSRGQLDLRRTLRRNMGWGGIPFVTAWKHKQIEKPRVMVLCDVSGSVAWVAQFLLMFIYALTEVLSDIRAFVYAGSMDEVSDILETRPIDAAVDEIMSTLGFGTSNYGAALADFEQGWMAKVTGRTSVIILGDARGNNTDPRTDVLERLAQRAKRIIWLNPEPRSAWGTGDSDMYRYAPYCNLVRVCSTLEDMERVITDLLEQSR